MKNWFTTLTGLPDDRPETVRDGITCDGTTLACPNGRVLHAGPLDTPQLAELRHATADLVHIGEKTRLREIVGDVQTLHQDPHNAGALFQVASQFNLLEMTGPSVCPEDGITRYEHDRTQGPACAIACAAGTIYRNYFVPVGSQTGQTRNVQIDCLADLGNALGNASGGVWVMRNGYALPSATGLVKLNKAIQDQPRYTLQGLLRIGVQTDTDVTLGSAQHAVTQAFCSALPVAYSDQSPRQLAPFAQLILEASYEATLLAAVLNKARTGNATVFLTLLGGGAFGNDPAAIISALSRAVGLVGQAGLDIAIVSHGGPSPHVRQLHRPE